MTTDTTLESLHPSRRCQSATTPKYRNRYHQYLRKLQEKNKLLRTEDNSKDEQLRQRENGFHLYVNGPHIPPRRPASASRKRIANPSNDLRTPSPFFSNHRGRWSSTNQTKIKTEQGSIIAEMSQPSPSRNNHITYRLNVDQSWMPNWYSQMKSTDSHQSLSLSLDDIPVQTQQLTYRLSPMVGR